MNQTPRITLDDCTWNKERKSLSVVFSYGRGYPAQIEVYSHYTGRVVTFTKDEGAALRNEFWDGEFYEYIPFEAIRNVTRLTVSLGDNAVI